MKQILLKHIVGFIYHHLTFDINWLVAIGIKRPLGLMFQGVVVFMPARCDGWLCVMNVLWLTKTYKEQISINTIVFFFFIEIKIQSHEQFLYTPLLQRFPAQHMESLTQRFRLLRQGRQTPRASLQNSSPPQSSSSVQTADCYNMMKETK